MKHIKLLGLFTIISLLSLAFVACEKEEAAQNLTAEEIEGEWEWFAETEDDFLNSLWLFGDGEFEHEWYYADGDEGEVFGTYTVSGNKLKLIYTDGSFADGDIEGDLSELQNTYTISLKGDILTVDGKKHQRIGYDYDEY